MTLDEARGRLAKIRDEDNRGDYEKAHNLEDELLWDFVVLVATRRMYYDAPEIADLLRSHLNSYSRGERWC